DWLVREGIASQISAFVGAQDLTPTGFFIVMALLLLLLGMVLEGYAIILLTMPLTIPILQALEIDFIHYAIFITIGIELAMLTPPVGLNMFVTAEVAKARVADVQRGVIPFFIAMLVLWILVIMFPQISTMLPDLIMGPR